MKTTQITVSKTFEVEHDGKTYYVDFVDSDGQTMALCNRDNWEVTTDDGESVAELLMNVRGKRQKAKLERTRDDLVAHAMRHFMDLDNELTANFEEYRRMM